jgi:hypothetical protein
MIATAQRLQSLRAGQNPAYRLARHFDFSYCGGIFACLPQLSDFLIRTM